MNGDHNYICQTDDWIWHENQECKYEVRACNNGKFTF